MASDALRETENAHAKAIERKSVYALVKVVPDMETYMLDPRKCKLELEKKGNKSHSLDKSLIKMVQDTAQAWNTHLECVKKLLADVQRLKERIEDDMTLHSTSITTAPSLMEEEALLTNEDLETEDPPELQAESSARPESAGAAAAGAAAAGAAASSAPGISTPSAQSADADSASGEGLAEW